MAAISTACVDRPFHLPSIVPSFQHGKWIKELILPTFVV